MAAGYASFSATVGPYADHWNGTTSYNSNALRRYTNIGTTVSGGTVTFYLTVDGTATGAALYSNVFAISAIGVYAGSTITSSPSVYVKSLSADRKTLVLGVTNGAVLTLLGATILAATAGYEIYVTVDGAK